MSVPICVGAKSVWLRKKGSPLGNLCRGINQFFMVEFIHCTRWSFSPLTGRAIPPKNLGGHQKYGR